MTPETTSPPPAKEPLTVLFADGQKGLEAELRKFLEKRNEVGKPGFKAVFAKNTKEALDHLNKATFSLIILEITLPIVNGYHLLDFLNRSPQRLPVVVYTKLSNYQDLVKIASHKVSNVFLKKLTSLQALAEFIETEQYQVNLEKKIEELKNILDTSREEDKEKRSKFTQCPRCHLIISPKAHFCNNCGQKIFKAATKQ